VSFHEMREMRLLHHGCFVDVESDGDCRCRGRSWASCFTSSTLVRQMLVLKKHGVAVAVLAAKRDSRNFFDVFEGFRQAGLFVDGVDGKVDGGDAGVRRDDR